jgi:hypothetical protein
MHDLDQNERNELEAIIDRRGLSSVLMALSEICGEKSERILSNWQDNWQDEDLARDWATAEGRIGVIVPSMTARGL